MKSNATWKGIIEQARVKLDKKFSDLVWRSDALKARFWLLGVKAPSRLYAVKVKEEDFSDGHPGLAFSTDAGPEWTKWINICRCIESGQLLQKRLTPGDPETEKSARTRMKKKFAWQGPTHSKRTAGESRR